MLNTLGDIYNYCNDSLLSGGLSSITEVVEYFQEAVNIIAEIHPIEATMVSTTLDATALITLPTDLLKVKEFRLYDDSLGYEDPTPAIPHKVWAGVAYFNPTNYNGRVINLYYYKKGSELTSGTLTQVPNIDKRLYYSVAQYAAEMWKLKDDDPEMQEAFRKKFITGLGTYSKGNSAEVNFKNYW